MYHSKEITKYQTAIINPWQEDGYDYKGVVQYGMHYIYNNSSPYFSITASTLLFFRKGGRWVEDSCGCLHDLIVKKKKSLAPLITFHLCDQNGLPMYYLENGYYWYKENLATFKDYIRLADDEIIPEMPKIQLPGILNDNGTEIDLPDEEQEKIIESARKKFITDWLRTREDKLKREFEEVMRRFNVEFITDEEIEDLRKKEKMNERAKVFNSYLGATPTK